MRDLLGKKLAIRFTSGLMASAKNSAQPMISNPALALNKRWPTVAKPIITSQKRIKVLVSIWTLVVLLIRQL